MLRGSRKTLVFPVLLLVAAALLAQQKGDAKKPVVWQFDVKMVEEAPAKR
jgi:hypothetical protein